MSEGLRIREAAHDDRAAIGALWQELMAYHVRFAPEEFDLADDALAVWLESLDQWTGDADWLVLVGEAQGELVGYLVAKTDQGPPVYRRREHGVIWDTCVAARWRRRGVGRKLTAYALDWFRSRGLSQAQVSAAACNSASNAFWRKMGFEPHMVQMRRKLEG
jgi:GNAT superfamily N-acetyltransferase